ncbi:inositol monophosphatase family protein [Cryptosporangium arvum]|uniref:inositol monophosphatase family protein n=1 Tax=Cryptosporangium arvum TaxID=80871 RepID=UPI0004B1B6ED
MGGDVNAVRGIPEWNIRISLVRDGRPVLALPPAPMVGETFTAVAGGAFLNGEPLRVSAKTDPAAALVGTGQARPGRDAARA